jgi:RNA polymerase sigma-B factor
MVSLASTPNSHDRDAYSHACLAEAARTSDRALRQQLRDEAVVLNMPMADSLARQYARRGIPVEDLIQVARLGLVAAANRYDATQGSGFAAYAVPTINGELRRYFRDTGWSIRPPRRVQEASLKIRRVKSELTQRLGRFPTASELAEEVGCDGHLVEEAQMAGGGYQHLSLDHESNINSDSESITLADSIGASDPDFDRAEARMMLRPVVDRLSDRDRRILELRFVEGLTQREVGEHIGVSQMQVSRILSEILATLRSELGFETSAA